MQTIGIQEMAGLRIGQVEDAKTGTGCTVLLCPEGMRAGLAADLLPGKASC